MFFKKFDFDPDRELDSDPELPEKSDPDPEIIFSDPTLESSTTVSTPKGSVRGDRVAINKYEAIFLRLCLRL